MRKILLVMVVLLFAAQAFAGTVTLSISDEGEGWATIGYSADANVSAFGLKVTADSGAIFTDINDYNIGECTATQKGYGIFPGTIDINDTTGVVDDNGTPVAPSSAPGAAGTGLGTDTLILEMGALYVEGNEPAKTGTLIAVEVNENCTVCVEGEPIRGNVVLTDANEAILDPNKVCQFIKVTGDDYGDAPDSYGTLWASGGPRHGDMGVMLGSVRDTEPDGQPSADAGDDDRNGGPDDEDGVVFNSMTAVAVDVNVTLSQAGYLNAWIDWDTSGTWTPAEKVISTYLGAGGTYNFVIPVPYNAQRNTDLFSRWRVTDACEPELEPGGSQDNGEVEDYNEPNVPMCHVPDVVGDPCDEAIAELIANGFTIGDITIDPNNEDVFYNYVVSTDPCYCNDYDCNEPVDIVVSGGSDCYLGQPDEDDWIEAGKPICWCYPRQCHGDADGGYEGNALVGYWYVGTPDLDIMSLGWKVKDPTKGPGILNQFVNGVPVACADFNHDKEGNALVGYWRIGSPDIDLMSLYWKVKEPTKGTGTPPNCPPGNRNP